MIVVDASLAAPALADDGADGARVRSRIRGETLFAPEIFDLEVVSVLRKHVAARTLTPKRAAVAFDQLVALRVARVPHLRLLPRIWNLRSTLTPYDAAYVAVAELTGATLLTGDRRLARAPGLRCTVEVLR
jgi:predicted nucleic acid-binding protein